MTQEEKELIYGIIKENKDNLYLGPLSFNYLSVEDDARLLADFFSSVGFLYKISKEDLNIKGREYSFIVGKIIIPVDVDGNDFRIYKVIISGDSPFFDSECKISIGEKERYKPYSVSDALRILNNYLYKGANFDIIIRYPPREKIEEGLEKYDIPEKTKREVLYKILTKKKLFSKITSSDSLIVCTDSASSLRKKYSGFDINYQREQINKEFGTEDYPCPLPPNGTLIGILSQVDLSP